MYCTTHFGYIFHVIPWALLVLESMAAIGVGLGAIGGVWAPEPISHFRGLGTWPFFVPLDLALVDYY